MIPIVYPGDVIPAPIQGSILEPYHAQCGNPPNGKLYPIYGSYYGNVYEKQFIAMGMRHDGDSLTGFGIRLAKRGTPNAPLLVGITLGAPPDDPLNPASYIEQAIIQPNNLPQTDAFYWVTFYLTTPIDVSHATPFVVAITNANYDTQSNYWIWGACNGIISGLDAAEKWIPEVLGLSTPLGSLDCQGPGSGWNCMPEGVDITVQPILVNDDDTPPYEPIENIVVGSPYKIIVTMHNGQPILWENYTLQFYWDGSSTSFDCYKDCINGGGDQTIEFTFTAPSLVNGEHEIHVRMLEKPQLDYIITCIVMGGPYEWSAAPDTVSFFSYTAGTGVGCTNPDGADGSWYCDGTTKKTCSGGSWASTPNSPDCQPANCTNPDGTNGTLHCFGEDLYKCVNGGWQLFTPNASQCAGCICGNLSTPDDCEDAVGSQGESCCWWYQRYLWEPATCHSTTQDYLRDYLPLIAIGGGLAVLVIALSISRRTQYIQQYVPEEPTNRKKGRK